MPDTPAPADAAPSLAAARQADVVGPQLTRAGTDASSGTPPSRWSDARFAHRTLIVVGIVTAAALLVYILATASYAFFLIFAGLVLAAVFCGLATALEKIGIPRTVGLIATYVALIGLLLVAVAWGGIAFVSQIGDLLHMVNQQIDRLPEALQQLGIPVGENFDAARLRSYLPNLSGLFSSARRPPFRCLGRSETR